MRSRLTARLPVHVGIQAFAAQFGDFFRLSGGNVVEKTAQIDTGVKRAQLLLVQVQHFVHSPLVFQLQKTKKQKLMNKLKMRKEKINQQEIS